MKLALAALATLTGLAAQTPVITLETATDVAVLAKTAGLQDHKAVPPNTPIPGGTKSLNLIARVQKDKFYASATTLAYPQPMGQSVAILERGYARGDQQLGDAAGTSASPQAAGAVFGAHSFLMKIQAPPGTKGTVSVSWHHKGDLGAWAKGSVDIGDDANPEWSGGGPGHDAFVKRFPAAVDKNGLLVVRLTTEAQAPGSGNTADWVNYFIDLFVGFAPESAATCTITPYGSGCGPVLAGGAVTTGGRHVITLLMTGGFPNSFALALTGTQALNLSLGGGCYLLSNGVAVALLPTDAQGDATQVWKVPVSLPGRSFHQFLPIALQGQSLVLQASNGLKVECR